VWGWSSVQIRVYASQGASASRCPISRGTKTSRTKKVFNLAIRARVCPGVRQEAALCCNACQQPLTRRHGQLALIKEVLGGRFIQSVDRPCENFFAAFLAFRAFLAFLAMISPNHCMIEFRRWLLKSWLCLSQEKPAGEPGGSAALSVKHVPPAVAGFASSSIGAGVHDVLRFSPCQRA
jgi:hypothetical protein